MPNAESQPLIPRRNFLPPRSPAFSPIRPRRRLLRLAARLAAGFGLARRYPFSRSQESFQKRGHIKIRIQSRKVNAETRRAEFNLREVCGLRVLQSLRILRTETHRDLRAKLNYSPSARPVVMRGDGAGKLLLHFPRPFHRRFEIGHLHNVGLTHESPSYPTKRCYVTDRKSTRLNSSHLVISYAVFCL